MLKGVSGASQALGPTSSPTFTGVTVTGLSVSSAVATDSNKALVSVTNTGTGSNVLGTAPTINGVALKRFVSAAQTITAGGALTLAHGMAAVPTLISTFLVCTSTEANYSVNDIVCVQPGADRDGANNTGLSIVPDATNLNVRFSNNLVVCDKTTGATTAITLNKWTMIFSAWVL